MFFVPLLVTFCFPPLSFFSLSFQRRPASVFAVPPWSTRCLLRSWATSCRVAPEAATWPGTTAVARRQHTHAPSNYCSSPAQRAFRYKYNPHKWTKGSVEDFLHCMWMTFKCVVAYEISCAGCSSELNRLDQNKHEKRKKASEAQTILGFTAVKSFVHNLSLILDFPATGQSQQLSKINHALFLLQSILRAVARGQFSQFDILVCLTFQWLMNMYNNDIQMKIYCTNTLYSTKKLTTSAVSYQMVLDEPLKGQCEGFIWCCWLEKLDPIPKLTLDIMEDHHQCLYI